MATTEDVTVMLNLTGWTTTLATLATNDTAAGDGRIFLPDWFEWFRPVVEFYAIWQNFAYWFVAPMMLFVYGGAVILYAIGQIIELTGFKIKVRRAKKLGLPPPKRKVKKKPDIFQRVVKKQEEIVQKKEVERQVKKAKKEEEIKKKVEERQKIEDAKPKMMTAEERKAYLRKYHAATIERERLMGIARGDTASPPSPDMIKEEQTKIAPGWSNSIAKAYARTFLSMTSPTPSEEEFNKGSKDTKQSLMEMDLWTLAQLTRMEAKRSRAKSAAGGRASGLSNGSNARTIRVQEKDKKEMQQEEPESKPKKQWQMLNRFDLRFDDIKKPKSRGSESEA
ncbi:uncharacterized protein LOC106152554 [Lingula anatina]|uniref:Uncharacterized protein LOC106152554 n=1 Tax=Lingula anatina TaxID=7574 RepID=A0A1S3H806_LINAN|nr:uncharacterized protein LOC106152554 [Lingula anatina]XP_013381623.1 uncharacterized protein LOC106152554 [Lingula anatina]|eukprot:XP_013381621.1 uncharacterized protein LOC106152554 [Lingula anatina]